MEKKQVVTGGMSFLDTLQVVFIVLKLLNVIDWKWLWVLSPLWGQLVVVVAMYLFVAVLKTIAIIHRKNKLKRMRWNKIRRHLENSTSEN